MTPEEKAFAAMQADDPLGHSTAGYLRERYRKYEPPPEVCDALDAAVEAFWDEEDPRAG